MIQPVAVSFLPRKDRRTGRGRIAIRPYDGGRGRAFPLPLPRKSGLPISSRREKGIFGGYDIVGRGAGFSDHREHGQRLCVIGVQRKDHLRRLGDAIPVLFIRSGIRSVREALNPPLQSLAHHCGADDTWMRFRSSEEIRCAERSSRSYETVFVVKAVQVLRRFQPYYVRPGAVFTYQRFPALPGGPVVEQTSFNVKQE